MSGLDPSYMSCQQALAFLPAGARGVPVLVKLADLSHAAGDVMGSFDGCTPRLAHCGVGRSRPSFTANLEWNCDGLQRLGPVAAGRSTAAGTCNGSSKRLVIETRSHCVVARGIVCLQVKYRLAAGSNASAPPNSPGRGEAPRKRHPLFVSCIWDGALRTPLNRASPMSKPSPAKITAPTPAQ
jgi:hypothetical protein